MLYNEHKTGYGRQTVLDERCSMDFSFSPVSITGGFWANMQKKNRDVTMNAVAGRFTETGRFASLKCAWKEGDPNAPHIFWDSDVVKWMEGAAYILAKHEDAELEAKVEEMIADYETHQWEDGYINSYFSTVESENRFTGRTRHELYCMGHLIEAAVAYYYATGKDRFLACAERAALFVDRYIRVEGKGAFVTPGHEEIELALLRLYRCTGKDAYLNLARFFLDQRGNNEKDEKVHDKWGLPNYDQQAVPVRKQTSAEGHAVRAMYLYTAMADYAAIVGDEEMRRACLRLYEDVTKRKMYITGGIGSTAHGEAFTVPYDLPSETAYAETCAAIGLMLFAQKMLEMEGDSDYADTVERVMYNGMLSGLSLSGDAFFYENPLSITLRNRTKNTSTVDKERYPITRRQKSFWCSCCPPNLNRILASMERFVYRKKDDTLFVDQYMEGSYTEGGVKVEIKTDYPVSGRIFVKAEGLKTLALRIPGWCRSFRVNAPYEQKGGYVYLENPCELILDLVMDVTLVGANPEVSDCAGKAAVMRGPVVYCAESVDNGGYGLYRFAFDADPDAEIGSSDAFGLPILSVKGWFRPDREELYAPVIDAWESSRINLIPYYAFANREECDMAVWLTLK